VRVGILYEQEGSTSKKQVVEKKGENYRAIRARAGNEVINFVLIGKDGDDVYSSLEEGGTLINCQQVKEECQRTNGQGKKWNADA